jgi:hypothetical protein
MIDAIQRPGADTARAPIYGTAAGSFLFIVEQRSMFHGFSPIRTL